MVFAKISTKVNCIASTVGDGFNICNNLPEESRIGIRNEIDLAQGMEDNTLLKDSLFGNKVRTSSSVRKKTS